MRLSSEVRLLIGLAVFVVLGAGALFFINRLQNPPAPTPVTEGIPKQTFDTLLKGARHIKGPADAQVTIVEFADFECSSCRTAYSRVASRFGEEMPVRFVFRHLPLENHPSAFPAAVAAEAAARQGKFWEMYRALFAPSVTRIDEAFIVASAKKAGLDMTRFARDRKDPALAEQVRTDIAIADAHKVYLTPTFFIRDGAGKITQATSAVALQKVLDEAGVSQQTTRR